MNFNNLLTKINIFYQQSMLSDLFIKTAIGETDGDEMQSLLQMSNDTTLGPALIKFRTFGKNLSKLTNRKILNCMLAFYEAKNKIQGSYTEAEDYISSIIIELNDIDTSDDEVLENAISEAQDILISLNEELGALAKANPEQNKDKEKFENFYRFISRLTSSPTQEGKSLAEKTFEEARPDKADAFEEVMLGSGEEGDAAKKGSIFIRKEFQDWETSVKEEKEKYEEDLKRFDAVKEPLIVSRLRSLIELIDKYIIPTAVEARDLENIVRLYGNNPTDPDAIKEVQRLASLKDLLKSYIIERRKEKATFRRDLSLYSIRINENRLKYLQDNKEELDSDPKGKSKIDRKKLEIEKSINEALSKRDYGRRAANKIRFKLLNFLNTEIKNGNLKNNEDFDSRPEIENQIKFYENLIKTREEGIKTKQEVDVELGAIRNSYAQGEYGPVYKDIWLLKKRIANYTSDDVTKIYTRKFINDLIKTAELRSTNPVYQRNKESIDSLGEKYKRIEIIKSSDKDYRNNREYYYLRSEITSQRNRVFESVRESLQQEFITVSDKTQADAKKDMLEIFEPIRDNLNKFYKESKQGGGRYANNLVRVSENSYHLFANNDTEKSAIESIIKDLSEANYLNLQNSLSEFNVFGEKTGKMTYDYKSIFNELISILESTPITTFQEETGNIEKKLSELDNLDGVNIVSNVINITEKLPENEIKDIESKVTSIKKMVADTGMESWQWLDPRNKKIRDNYTNLVYKNIFEEVKQEVSKTPTKLGPGIVSRPITEPKAAPTRLPIAPTTRVAPTPITGVTEPTAPKPSRKIIDQDGIEYESVQDYVNALMQKIQKPSESAVPAEPSTPTTPTTEGKLSLEMIAERARKRREEERKKQEGNK